MTDTQKSSDATRYFVITIGGEEAEFSLHPQAFDNEGDARKHAEECALKNPKIKFGVFQKIGTASADLAVTWKGQTG